MSRLTSIFGARVHWHGANPRPPLARECWLNWTGPLSPIQHASVRHRHRQLRDALSPHFPHCTLRGPGLPLRAACAPSPRMWGRHVPPNRSAHSISTHGWASHRSSARARTLHGSQRSTTDRTQFAKCIPYTRIHIHACAQARDYTRPCPPIPPVRRMLSCMGGRGDPVSRFIPRMLRMSRFPITLASATENPMEIWTIFCWTRRQYRHSENEEVELTGPEMKMMRFDRYDTNTLRHKC